MFKNKKTLSVLLIWIALQILCSFPASLIMLPIGKLAGLEQGEINSLIILIALLLSQILELVIFKVLGYFHFKDIVHPIPDLFTLTASVIAGFSLFYAIDLVQTQFDIPDMLEQDMDKLTASFWGFLAICIIGPIAEEVMMRRIILRDLWRRTGKMWSGILLSALIFAAIHINPAQVVFAFPAGVILGWLYCISGTLVVPIIIHILNNTVSFISIRMGSSEPDLNDPIQIAVLLGCIAISTLFILLIISGKRKKGEPLYADLSDKPESEPTIKEQ